MAAPAVIYILDLLLGDPSFLPHPVVFMGKMIGTLERLLRNDGNCSVSRSRTGRRRTDKASGESSRTDKNKRDLIAGAITAIAFPAMTILLTGGIYFILYRFFKAEFLTGLVILLLLDLYWGYQSIAVKDMLKESVNVYRSLSISIDAARQAVGRIVGRDTEILNKEGIIKATVESVAESFSDGFGAPLFYYTFGGAPLALCYKSINTMDSMIGYKNDRYLYFGRAAAKLDDLVNYLPSRLSALILIIATFFYGLIKDPLHRADIDQKISAENAIRIWRRDRRKHASPNSAQTEAVMAGALGVELAGGAWYFGKYYDKPTIGDPTRQITEEDILRANRIYLIGSVFGVICSMLVRVILICLLARYAIIMRIS
ncbi:MAG: cobalamin biosynthesis protein CobD [Lachnospiraceae bacterium]|nr:cobalamin biosynthesis protein CobD [Lachnospiraceae bacterium]